MTRQAFENAMVVIMVLGGSTNAVLHMLAIAHAANVPLSIDDFERIRRIQEGAQGSRLPSPDELRRQVLDALIDEKVQLSYARNMGMNVGDAELDSAIENIAAQNQLSLAELRQRMAVDGLDYDRYRTSLREQILVQRLREREVTARIPISDDEVTAFLKEDPAAQMESALNLAHILVAVPEGATPAQLAQAQAKAADLQRRVAGGENFAKLVKQYSDDSNTRDEGGAFGMHEFTEMQHIAWKS